MNFNEYSIEESIDVVKKNTTQLLDNLNSLIIKFSKIYENNPNYQVELNSLIYEHKIYKSRKKFASINQIINKAKPDVDLTKILDNKSNTTMYEQRKEHIEKVKTFVKENKNLLVIPNKQIEGGFKQLEEGNFSEDDIVIENSNLLGKKKNKVVNSVNNDKLSKKKSSIIFTNCYICKKKFNEIVINHHFYPNICKVCGDYNYSFRELIMDMKGRIAVVTGGRVKIGYYIVLKLLNYGCKVIATTRFPKDSLVRFMQEPNYNKFKDNLLIYPLDLRLINSLEKFITYLYDNFSHLDILINNAAQTVRRTTSYYNYLLDTETKPMQPEEENMIIKNDNSTFNLMLGSSEEENIETIQNYQDQSLPVSVISSQVKMTKEDFNNPMLPSIMGPDQQPIDFSQNKTSWNLEIDEVSFAEFAEVQMINTWAPYFLCAKLKKLMMKSPFIDRYIINVSSVEGIFNHFKRTTHPHTNMSKAALNMLTRTVARHYKDFGIYMTAVDTGWVSTMNEYRHLLNNKNQKAFEDEYLNVPLDELDGAMRVLHPVIEGVQNKKYLYGYLMKDYKITNW